jgi:hypothetical protein
VQAVTPSVALLRNLPSTKGPSKKDENSSIDPDDEDIDSPVSSLSKISRAHTDSSRFGGAKSMISGVSQSSKASTRKKRKKKRNNTKITDAHIMAGGK